MVTRCVTSELLLSLPLEFFPFQNSSKPSKNTPSPFPINAIYASCIYQTLHIRWPGDELANATKVLKHCSERWEIAFIRCAWSSFKWWGVLSQAVEWYKTRGKANNQISLVVFKVLPTPESCREISAHGWGMCGISEGVFQASRWPSECTLVGVHDLISPPFTFLFLIWTAKENSSWPRNSGLYKRGSHFEVHQVINRCRATDDRERINTRPQTKAPTCCSGTAEVHPKLTRWSSAQSLLPCALVKLHRPYLQKRHSSEECGNLRLRGSSPWQGI